MADVHQRPAHREECQTSRYQPVKSEHESCYITLIPNYTQFYDFWDMVNINTYISERKTSDYIYDSVKKFKECGPLFKKNMVNT